MKDDLLYLAHMLEFGRKVSQILERTPRVKFDESEEVQLALTHLIQIIGEAATKLSASTTASLPTIPWPSIVNMRHRIVHDYFNINADVVWETATRAIPQLLSILEPYVAQRVKDQPPRKL